MPQLRISRPIFLLTLPHDTQVIITFYVYATYVCRTRCIIANYNCTNSLIQLKKTSQWKFCIWTLVFHIQPKRYFDWRSFGHVFHSLGRWEEWLAVFDLLQTHFIVIIVLTLNLISIYRSINSAVNKYRSGT